jgi:UDP-N-acetylmuramate: L-alanyl-gamma-D-glutamyl-meso-diaminopimelate ligase
MQKIHFIAIGGAAMHNLAIALKKKGYLITGSDDEIFEPSLTQLKSHDLLPETLGWDQSKVHKGLDCVILGMHAKPDNPELLKAQEIGAKIFSYPEFLYEQTKDKKRVVIAGSHGKTTITAMVIHVLTSCKIKFDFMVGSQIDGFDTMVSLNDDSEVAVFEGDEYLSSPVDLRPKFFHYHPHIALISGIAWDHINVFPNFDIYKEQFNMLIHKIEENGSLVYFAGDDNLKEMANKTLAHIRKYSYTSHSHQIVNGQTYLIDDQLNQYPIKLFGRHNLENINGARKVCNLLGVSDAQFYQAISVFGGTSKRLQLLAKNDNSLVFLDFAHSPSKVSATVKAVREQYSDKRLVAVFELHTFSSLNKEFIPQYAGSLDSADEQVVFFNKEVIEHKRMPELSDDFVKDSFSNKSIRVLSEKNELFHYLNSVRLDNTVLLLMSSGNYAGININELVVKLCKG